MQQTEQGQIIVMVRTTDNATGNHCHLKLKYYGEWLNPEDYIDSSATVKEAADS